MDDKDRVKGYDLAGLQNQNQCKPSQGSALPSPSGKEQVNNWVYLEETVQASSHIKTTVIKADLSAV